MSIFLGLEKSRAELLPGAGLLPDAGLLPGAGLLPALTSRR